FAIAFCVTVVDLCSAVFHMLSLPSYRLLLFLSLFFFFFFHDTATTEIYTLSLHDALPISSRPACIAKVFSTPGYEVQISSSRSRDRKSTRLNSSHGSISYAVFCLKKKKIKKKQ